ncbi:endonuclease/exonuclease/phosphatase family protein [Nocardioides pacificus]
MLTTVVISGPESVAVADDADVVRAQVGSVVGPRPGAGPGSGPGKIGKNPVALRVGTLNTRFDKVGDAAFLDQLDTLHRQGPNVLLLQETQHRLRPMRRWAAKHRYFLYAPGSGSSSRHESVVLFRRDGRFTFRSADLRLGSGHVRREGGVKMAPRYIATVRVLDRRTNRHLAFSSTHAVPEVQYWPGEKVMPRRGTSTLRAFLGHMRAIRSQVKANARQGAISILGGDLNAGAEYEDAWKGFMSDAFGSLMVSNHRVLGQVPTFVADSDNQERSIDYIFASRSPGITFVSQQTMDVVSDHHALIVSFLVTPR